MKLSDSARLRRVISAAEKLMDAVMSDEGGFCLETLHAMVELGQVAGLPDGGGVVAATGWSMEGGSEERPRFWSNAAAREAGIEVEGAR